jgi:hypothetical protein
MSHGTEHHLEEAEHAQHHAADPFAARVAMTMAIIAAGLACVVMLSHRSHNETLVNITKASDQWGYFQAKKNRGYMYDALADLRGEMSADTARLAQDIGELKPKSKAEGPEEESSPAGPDAGKEKKAESDKPNTPQEKWRARSREYEQDSEKIKKDAVELQHNAEHAHHMSALFDLGELGIELALVLCSLAVLTRKRNFWYSGMVIGAAGFAVAMLAFTPFGVSMIAKVVH